MFPVFAIKVNRRTLSKMNLSKNNKPGVTLGRMQSGNAADYKSALRVFSYGTFLIAMLVFAGCKGMTQPGEKAARQQLATETANYRPEYNAPALPLLTTNSPLSDFLTYAILNHPAVAANYYDWAASVERITIERSRPDPKLTFEAYIAGTITSLMPGLMTDIPGPGKLAARARVATAESEGKYFTFKSSMLQTAFDVKKAYYQLHYLDEKIRVNRQTLQLLTGLELIARTQNETGKGTLQDVLKTQIEADKLGADIANLEDSRRSLMAQFKASLGLTPRDPEPPLPAGFVSTPLDLTDEKLFETALAQNLQLKAMQAEIRRAEASIQLARKDRVPDFSVGGEVDVKAAPVVWNPQLSMTLPIWRDKIAAEIAEAQQNKRSAEARFTAGQISLAVDFAEKAYSYREANRNLSVLDSRLLPRAQQSLDVTRAAYLSGQLEFLDVIDAERVLLDLQLERVAAQMQREISLAELSLIISGATPTESPMAAKAVAGATSAPKSKSKSGGM
jgi:outer membrane protein, heavy metal efflux system